MSSIVFDQAVDYYDQTRGFPPGVEQEVAQLFVQAGKLTRASHVVEVGVGTGRIALPLAPHAGFYAGVDLSRPMMMRLRGKENPFTVHLAEGDITRLPLADQCCDAVIAVHIFHLVPDWQTALREAARILKPGGYLLHGGNGPSPQIDVLWNAIDKSYPSGKQVDIGVKLDERQEFLVQAGWQPVGEAISYKFVVERAPQQYLENVKNRIWSRLWRLTDEELAGCVDAVKTAIAENFDDPDRPLALENTFEVRAFIPPTG